MTKAQSPDYQELSSHYVQRMRKLPLLTIDEEYKLAKKWREEGDHHAMSKLIESHLRLVAKIATGYRGYGLPLSDLICEGNVGMMQAMKHFDPDRGFRLSTYAMWWIKAAIQDYVIRTWSLVRIGTTVGQKRLFFNLRKERKNLGQEDLNLSPEMITELANVLGVREDEIIHMNYRLGGMDKSLNTPMKGEDGHANGGSEWVDWLADERESQEVAIIEADEVAKRKDLFNQAMESLTPREREIIYSRRLKDPVETLETVADKLDISRERVRQIELKAFEKLQRTIKQLTSPKFHHI